MSGIIINPYVYAGEAFPNTYSFEFDAVDTYISAEAGNNTPNSWPALPRNFSLWFKHVSFPVTDFQPLFCGWRNASNKFRYTAGAGIKDGYLRWVDANGAGQSIAAACHAVSDDRLDGSSSAPNVLDGNWHHIFIYNPIYNDGSGADRADIVNAEMWVDGGQLAITTGEGSLDLRGSLGDKISIGGGSSGGSTTKFQITGGFIDEFAYWDSASALSSDAIEEIYNSGTPNDLNELSNAPDPDSWYRMGDAATFSNPGGVGDWTLTDQGTHGYNGTSINFDEDERVEDVP